ncbi:methylated-DNA--[protein]-cysteine S-methyltransferase [candidate division KSB3 bacterium]|uniref:Methylated-DNA--protein-cysteine methyltransferase n=1 Tax=candidate division KSB3 bacterium TaxID=2044937 RepID=A0A9D5JV48_9BACT|nr:methylated-DNA--[protein]-cysteine S-methyltransferase [candidate division KSB3 bacterium]MBD3324730.1 methylated-DNA--[protein]-cysteine S-methyltransferase [candidate division KSB3 bacterium]
MRQPYTTYYHSPIGPLEIRGTEEGIRSICFVEETAPSSTEIPPCLATCARQLEEYFQGQRQEFSVDLLIHGTEFQRRVWQQLQQIPFGHTASYLDIATALGNPKAIRAVGNANGKNPISIMIPCHRIIGTNGKLIGYGGGLWRKEWLLRHEKSCLL